MKKLIKNFGKENGVRSKENEMERVTPETNLEVIAKIEKAAAYLYDE